MSRKTGRKRGMPAGMLAKRPDGTIAGTKGLTPLQEAFVELHVKNGLCATDAARKAGYADAGAMAFRLMRLPHIIAAIQEARNAEISDLATLGLARVRDILTTKAETQGHRELQAKIAFQMLDRAGHAVRKDAEDHAPDKALAEMSVEELEAFIRRGHEAMAAARQPIIDGEAVTLDGPPALPAPEPAPEIDAEPGASD